MKKKELVNELDILKKKGRRLETDVEGLVKSADEFAQKAEETGKLVWITKLNTLRRTAKEIKEKTRKDVEDKIVNVAGGTLKDFICLLALYYRYYDKLIIIL